jgi:hypothetical protein
MEFRTAQFVYVHEGDSADLRSHTSGLGAFKESVETPPSQTMLSAVPPSPSHGWEDSHDSGQRRTMWSITSCTCCTVPDIGHVRIDSPYYLLEDWVSPKNAHCEDSYFLSHSQNPEGKLRFVHPPRLSNNQYVSTSKISGSYSTPASTVVGVILQHQDPCLNRYH